MSVRIGWVGCGTHASQMLLPQLVRHDVELAAVCDTDAARRARVMRAYGVKADYADARDLLAHPGLDAIGLAVGPEAHVEIGLAALARGLPVFMEKPPAADVKGAERLAAASETSGRPVVVGFMKRYSTGNRIARNIVASGRFGRVLGLMGWYMTAPTYFAGAVDYSSFFLHHCIHYMDLIPWFGGPIVEVTGRKMENGPGRLLLQLSFGLEGGAIASLAMGTVQSRGNPVEFLQLMGDHSRIEVSNVAEIVWYRDPPFKADDPGAMLEDGRDALVWRPNLTAAANEDHKGYHALLGDALTAIRGEPSNAPTIRDGVAAMRNLERVRAALGL